MKVAVYTIALNEAAHAERWAKFGRRRRLPHRRRYRQHRRHRRMPDPRRGDRCTAPITRALTSPQSSSRWCQSRPLRASREASKHSQRRPRRHRATQPAVRSRAAPPSHWRSARDRHRSPRCHGSPVCSLAPMPAAAAPRRIAELLPWNLAARRHYPRCRLCRPARRL